jgi:hypothetical protein
MIWFRGIPYIAVGYGSMFTSRKTRINKVWYVFGTPVAIKTYLLDTKHPVAQWCVNKIENHPEMTIEKIHFDDHGMDVPPGTEGAYSMYSVYAENEFGRFYIGNIEDAYRFIGMHKFMNSELGKRNGVANVAKNIKLNKWCGWSHRAMMCFEKGDKIFDPNFGDEYTPFKEHGEKEVITDRDALLSAMKFANYVS